MKERPALVSRLLFHTVGHRAKRFAIGQARSRPELTVQRQGDRSTALRHELGSNFVARERLLRVVRENRVETLGELRESIDRGRHGGHNRSQPLEAGIRRCADHKRSFTQKRHRQIDERDRVIRLQVVAVDPGEFVLVEDAGTMGHG
jgi:hypothetical protein